jgi:hypothetical protein
MVMRRNALVIAMYDDLEEDGTIPFELLWSGVYYVVDDGYGAMNRRCCI